jgi:hypothetical protein
MQSIVTEAIQISAIAGSDLTIDRSVESASLAVLEESLKKLPVQGFLDTAIEAMKSDLLTVRIASKLFAQSALTEDLLRRSRLEGYNWSSRGCPWYSRRPELPCHIRS